MDIKNKILLAFILYLIMLLSYGFSITHEGAGAFSYSLFLLDKSLYPEDLFIQSLNKYFFNERIFYSIFIIPAAHFPVLAILYHIIFGIIMFLGFITLSEIFIKNKFVVILSVLFSVHFLYLTNWGANEIYYKEIIPSFLAKSSIIWSFVFVLQKRKLLYVIFPLIFGTFMQPLVGLHAFILLIPFFLSYVKKNIKNIFPLVLWVITAGIYIFMLMFSHFSEKEPSLYNQIIFHLRASFHFIPECFSKKGWIVFPTLLGIILYFYYRKNKLLFFSFLILTLGIMIYLISFYIFDSYLLLSGQWFRATIWVKPFGFIALFSIIQDKIPQVRIENLKFLLFSAVLVLLFAIYKSVRVNKNIELYEFVPTMIKEKPIIDVSLKLKEISDKNSVVLHPLLEVAEVKFWSQRSCYVDWHHMIHVKPEDIKKWAERVNTIFGLQYKNITCNTSELAKAKQNFLNFIKDKEKVKLLGINYLIVPSNVCIKNYKKLYSNKKWSLYKVD